MIFTKSRYDRLTVIKRSYFMDNFSCVCYDESRKLPQYSDRIRIFDGILLKPVRKGTFMNYFLYTSKYTDLHYEESKKYITQQYQNGDLIKVSFNDENYVDYMRDSGGLEVIKDSVIYAFGEDGYYYRLYNDRTEKGEKYPPGMPKRVVKQTLRLVKEVRKNKDYQKNMARRFGSNTVNKFSGSAGFERFIYLKGNDAVLFRFKKAGIKNQPLVIYFGGAGTIGRDNFKPLFEFFFTACGYRFLPKKCNILVPQYVRLCNYNTESELRDAYADNCADIIKYLIESYGVDSKRIYIYGSSFGGGLVWNFLFRHPQLIAAAVETMGEYHGKIIADEKAFDSISSIPIWMAHASDDKVVSIKSDDQFYNALKKAGSDVIYTRWDQYGHSMCGHFYRKEKWLNWLLSKSK